MYFKLNLATGEITEASQQQAESAMRIFGYRQGTISRLKREATAFYTGEAFYSSNRSRLEEEVRENAASAPSLHGAAEIQSLCLDPQ